MGKGKKEDESQTGRVLDSGFHHVRVRSSLALVLKSMKGFFSLIFTFFQAAVNSGYCTIGYGGTTVLPNTKIPK
jgi:hypothetical protein